MANCYNRPVMSEQETKEQSSAAQVHEQWVESQDLTELQIPSNESELNLPKEVKERLSTL